MTKNIALSIVVVVPLFGIGGLAGSSIRPQAQLLEPNAAVTIQPFEMHRAADIKKIPETEISNLF